jgi:hypothetical protein
MLNGVWEVEQSANGVVDERVWRKRHKNPSWPEIFRPVTEAGFSTKANWSLRLKNLLYYVESRNLVIQNC